MNLRKTPKGGGSGERGAKAIRRFTRFTKSMRPLPPWWSCRPEMEEEISAKNGAKTFFETFLLPQFHPLPCQFIMHSKAISDRMGRLDPT